MRKTWNDLNLKEYTEENSECVFLYSKKENNRLRIYLQCKCGNKYNIRLDQFKKKKQCNICSKEERQITFGELQDEFIKRDYLLLSEKYINNHTKLEYMCLKHKDKGILQVTWQDIKIGKGCYYCGIEKIKAKKTISFNDIEKRLMQFNLISLTTKDEYNNMSQKINAINEDKYLFAINLNNIKQFKPTIFGGSNPYSIQNIKNWLIKNNIDLEVKSDIFIKANNKLIWTCKKHGDFETSWNSIKNGSRCPKCNQSKGEEKIFNILKKLNINFISQFKIDNCKNKRPLPFDYAIFDKNNQLKVLVEYDGEQHYKVARYSKDKNKMLGKLKDVQKRDNIKNIYCELNNIQLLRIPYWDFNNIEIILTKIIN